MMYLLHAGGLLAACFLYYWLMLRNETHFGLNRWVLLACLIGSLTLPLVTMPAGWTLREALAPQTVAPATLTAEGGTLRAPSAPATLSAPSQSGSAPTVEAGEATGPVAAAPVEVLGQPSEPSAPPATPIDWGRLLWWTYLAGVGVFGLHFLIQLIYLMLKVWRNPGFDAGGFHLVELEEDAAPYSFWNRVFLNPNRYDPDTFHQIVQHEAVHVRQRHSVDLLLAELVVVLQWWNPFAWLYRRAIDNNLEFLTDAAVLRQGEDAVSYQLSLVKVAAPNFPLGLTTSYNQKLLEKRIAMMKSKKSSLASGWKYLTILPFLLVSMLQFNAVAQTPPVPPTAPAPPATPVAAPAQIPAPGVAPTSAPAPSPAPASAPNATPPTAAPVVVTDVVASPAVVAVPEVDVVTITNTAVAATMEAIDAMEYPAPTANGDVVRRSWTAEIEDDEVCFTFIVTEGNRQYLSTNSRCFPRAELGQLPTGAMGDFALRRASGTVTFNGMFKDGEGLGNFNFTPNADFRELLASEGYEYEDMELLHFFFIDFTPGYLSYLKREGYQPTERQLFKLAVFGLSEAEFKAATKGYQTAGYGKPDLKKMIELRIHGVTESYIDRLGKAGYDGLSLDQVMKAKIHGLSPEFIEDMATAGFRNLSFEQVIKMAIHNVSSEYVAELNQLGYTGLDAEEVVKAKIHGVSTQGLADLRSAGMENLSLKEARDAAIHNVDAAYIRELAEIGYTDIDIQDAIKAKIHGVSKYKTGNLSAAGLTDLTLKQARDAAIHGVDEAYVRELAELGYTNLKIEEVIQARIHGVSRYKLGDLKQAGLTDLTLKQARDAAIHGVTASEVEAIRQLGYTDLDIDDFVKARIHGVTPRFIRSYEGLGFGTLSFEQLVKLRIHDVSPEFIKKYKREGDSIEDLISDKVRGRYRR